MNPKRTCALAGISALVLALAFAGCGGGGGGTGPSSTIPNLVGDFAGTWTQDWTVDGQPVPTFTCAGTLTVPNQSGNTFYGRSTLAAPCDQGLGGAGAGRGGVLSISDGRIEGSGALTFRFSEDPRVGLSGGGCTVTAMPAFSGTFSGNTITAQRTEAYDCTASVDNPFRYTVTIRLSATR
jgi:hypothetical protein